MKLLWLACLLFISGCSVTGKWITTVTDDELPGRASDPVYLSAVPFNPQEKWQCGPAALATILQFNGVETSPAALKERIYVEGSRGSYQAEMPAAIRESGQLPYLLAPTLAAVKAELDAGRPVLIYQNLGLEILPRWHYSVAVGYDAEQRKILLRSGVDRLQLVDEDYFAYSWETAGSWALVALGAGELPAWPDERRYTEALAAFDLAPNPELQEKSWAVATARWPHSSAAWFGYGNARYAAGDLRGAIKAYERSHELSPDDPAILNNLAYALGKTGCKQLATRLIRQALANANPEAGFYAEIQNTAAEIDAMLRTRDCQLRYSQSQAVIEQGR